MPLFVSWFFQVLGAEFPLALVARVLGYTTWVAYDRNKMALGKVKGLEVNLGFL